MGAAGRRGAFGVILQFALALTARGSVLRGGSSTSPTAEGGPRGSSLWFRRSRSLPARLVSDPVMVTMRRRSLIRDVELSNGFAEGVNVVEVLAPRFAPAASAGGPDNQPAPHQCSTEHHRNPRQSQAIGPRTATDRAPPYISAIRQNE